VKPWRQLYLGRVSAVNQGQSPRAAGREVTCWYALAYGCTPPRTPNDHGLTWAFSVSRPYGPMKPQVVSMGFNFGWNLALAGLWNASARGLLEIPSRELGSGREAGLGEDAPDVAFHRPLGQHERACDLAVG
jgi:hypothetical protein